MDDSAHKADVPVIEMTGVAVGSREDPDVCCLEKISWTVMPGEYWVIGGLHGSGKSDFLFTSAGLTPPLGGGYRLFGHEMPVQGDTFLSERLRIGLVFDGGMLFHGLTIEENIALPLRYHRELARESFDQSIKSMLDMTGLSALAGRLPGNLGRAWEKRAGLARALVLQPEVLLLDDPLGGLDSHHVHWWLGALDQLSTGHGFFEGRPMTLVVATGDLRPWRNRAAHFGILQNHQFYPLGHHPDLGRLTDPLVKELLAESLGTS